MDLNLIVLCGQLATDPELRVFESGTRLMRYLVTIRADHPRKRVDVIPVTLWDPPADLIDSGPRKGERVMVVGSVQRRYWEADDGRRSRVEVVAESIEARDTADLETTAVS
ncbi:MAG: single-stranded DNA-binding protein [Acidimicrobiia bacterium]